MNNKKIIVFLLVCLVQWAVLGRVVVDWYTVLQTGTPYVVVANLSYSRTDGSVGVNVRNNKLPMKYNQEKQHQAYLVIARDEQGYLLPQGLEQEKPVGRDYLLVYTWQDGESTAFRAKISDYALRNGKKLNVEEIVRNHNNQVLAYMKIKNDIVIVERITVNGIPLEEWQ